MSPRKPAPDDETPARGMAQTDTAIKAQFSRDEKGAMSGSLKISGKVLAIVGGLLVSGGTALGYFGHGEQPPTPVAIESRVVALEVERKGDDKRIEKLEDAMRDLDKDVRELLKLRAKSGG